VRDAYVETVLGLRRRAIPTLDLTARVRLSKTPDEYLATRDSRREHAYEAMFAAGRTRWESNERVRFYRATAGRAVLVPGHGDDDTVDDLARDYDVEHYLRVLRTTFASRLERALTPDDFATVFEDPEQPSLFTRSLAGAVPILTML
jgi:hypothetical protein